MNEAFLALGSNMGDKIALLQQAVKRIDALHTTRVTRRSAIYRTPPWGKTDQDWFANGVVAVTTQLSPEALLDACLGIEADFGRERLERWGPRLIDLDLLAYGDERRDSATLTLPHPAMSKRAFVLIPLRDVAPHLVIEGEPLSRHLARLDVTGIEPLAHL